jgi:hypothetical protein
MNTGGTLAQVVLTLQGLLAVGVMWGERKHEAALVFATAWTAACWLAAPGWARWPTLALTAIALLVTATAYGQRRRTAQRAERERELDRLLDQAGRELWTTTAVLPLRLQSYAQAARLIAADSSDLGAPPAPPAEPRPGPSQLWQALDDAHTIAAAAQITVDAGLAKPPALREALQLLAVAADDVAAALSGGTPVTDAHVPLGATERRARLALREEST